MHPAYRYVGPVQIRLLEELGELTKAICKAERFGLSNFHPNDPAKVPNLVKIRHEMADVRRLLDEYEDYLRNVSI